MRRDALFLIMYLEQKLPYGERKIMTFAMTLLELGEAQLAYEILLKFQNPDEEIIELQDALSKML